MTQHAFSPSSAKQLHTLITSQGERDLYDSAVHCTRCGSCAQSCPIYRLKSRESLSPRGRNQILRLALEQKLDLNASNAVLYEALSTCTLCGHCTQNCPGDIPTAEHVLEMRRKLHLRILPHLLHLFLALRSTRPALFARLANTALFLRNIGLIKILRFFQITKLPFLTWLNHLDDILPAKTSPLAKELQCAHIPLSPKKPYLIYLPSLEAEFILPDLAIKTISQAYQRNQLPVIWQNVPTGLFDYIYGDLRQCRWTLRALLRRHARCGRGKLPLITDSIDIYMFLKRAPQLFKKGSLLRTQADFFATRVRYVSDIFFVYISKEKKARSTEHVFMERSALFGYPNDAFKQAERNLYTLFGKNLLHCLYTDAVVPAFGYTFVAPKKATQIGLKAVEKFARTRTRLVVTLSGLASLELAYLLHKFYPEAKATHFVHVDR